jgi:hypothetical protein
MAMTGPTAIPKVSRGGPVFIQPMSGSAVDKLSFSFQGTPATLSTSDAGKYLKRTTLQGT